MRAFVWRVLVAGACFPALLAGCQSTDRTQRFTATVLNPLNLKLPFLPYQQPVRIGIVHELTGIFDPASWDIAKVGSPWTPFAQHLQRRLNRPVQIEDLKAFQVAAHLQSGRVDFAFLAADDYVRLVDEFGELGEIIAVSEVRTRQGLIVTKASSKVESLADIKGKRFAFGPIGDDVLDKAAKATLVANGVSLDSLQKELLPIPGSFQHHISSNEAAYEIVYGLGTDAGVIEKSEYDAYPGTGGSLLFRTFSKSNFRVLGQTEPTRVKTISEGPFLAARDTDPKLVEQVRKFLIEAAERDRSALHAMGIAAFRQPAANVKEQLRRLVDVSSVHLAEERP